MTVGIGTLPLDRWAVRSPPARPGSLGWGAGHPLVMGGPLLPVWQLWAKVLESGGGRMGDGGLSLWILLHFSRRSVEVKGSPEKGGYQLICHAWVRLSCFTLYIFVSFKNLTKIYAIN